MLRMKKENVLLNFQRKLEYYSLGWISTVAYFLRTCVDKISAMYERQRFLVQLSRLRATFHTFTREKLRDGGNPP